jgi:hypothetical protein
MEGREIPPNRVNPAIEADVRNGFPGLLKRNYDQPGANHPADNPYCGQHVGEPSRRVRESASAHGRASQSNAVIASGPSGQVEAQHPHGRRGAAAAHGLIQPAVGVAGCDHDREKPDNVPYTGLWISDIST